jgi:hypothetical protein
MSRLDAWQAYTLRARGKVVGRKPPHCRRPLRSSAVVENSIPASRQQSATVARKVVRTCFSPSNISTARHGSESLEEPKC